MNANSALQRRRRITRRALPALGVLGLAALAAGIVIGSASSSGGERTAEDFARAWDRGDYAAMHRLLGTESQQSTSRAALERAYRRAADVATASVVEVGEPDGERGGAFVLPVKVQTRAFGEINGEVLLPVVDEAVGWKPHLVFPGLPDGATLSRRTQAPRRAAIESIDAKTLAEGDAGARSYPDPAGASIVGEMALPETEEERRALYVRGFPEGTPVGRSGLERAFESELAGRPGGELIAAGRVIARSTPLPSPTVRVTIDTRLQAAAAEALAGRFGGIAALDPRTGAIRALAGVAFSAPQPPGSTFKIITTAAALEHKLVKVGDEFPVVTEAIIDGVSLENANGESCGGDFTETFAHSCNSVFAPLGVKVGSKRLVEMSERFGFNEKATIPGEMPSTLPASDGIVSPLEIGSTAIGQFKVLATPLQMASVAQTIANDGVRIRPTLNPGQRPNRVRVLSKRIANTITGLMVAVTGYGTGTAAAIPGVKVAGKTGTAELGDTKDPVTGETKESDPSNTDAWFTSFAPAERPKIVVAALFVRNGSGGAVAAPAARIVLGRALGK